jgi:hypothetical protein
MARLTATKAVKLSPVQRLILSALNGENVCLEAEANHIMTHLRVKHLDDSVTVPIQGIRRLKMTTFRAMRDKKLITQKSKRTVVNAWQWRGEEKIPLPTTYRVYVLSRKGRQSLSAP